MNAVARYKIKKQKVDDANNAFLCPQTIISCLHKTIVCS